MLDGACMNLFLDALGRFLYHDLVRSSPAAAGPSITILRDSLTNPGIEPLVKVFYTYLLDPLVEILVKSSKRSLHDLIQVLLGRSCGDSAGIILKSSLHEDLANAVRWCLYASSSGMFIRISCMNIL